MAGVMGSVLLTDGNHRASLSCLRALGSRGYRCHVVGPTRRSLAGASRWCRSTHAVPDCRTEPEAFLEEMSRLIRTLECDVLIPVTEETLRRILPRKSSLPPVRVPFPSHEVFSRISDKAVVLEAARELEMAVPAQWKIEGPDDPRLRSPEPGSFPLAVKPTKSVRAGDDDGTPAVFFVSGPGELRSRVGDLPPTAFPVLVQERIRGHGAGVFLLLWEGELRAVMGHRRIREKPPSGGVSVVRESTVVDPELLEQSMALLSSLGWKSGVAMVEFKVEAGSRTPYLMEINGRFWGSLQLAVDAGVNFPALLLECDAGTGPGKVVVGRPGVRTRWLMGDVDQLLLRLTRSKASLDLTEDDPGRLRAMASFMADFRPGVRTEVLKLSDPRPFFSELRSWVGALGRGK